MVHFEVQPREQETVTDWFIVAEAVADAIHNAEGEWPNAETLRRAFKRAGLIIEHLPEADLPEGNDQ